MPEKRNRIKALTEEREGLVKQMPKAANEAEAKMQADLQAKRAALATIQQTIAADKQRLQRIADIRARVQAFGSQMTRFATDLTSLLDEAGIPQGERAPFKPAFPADTEPPLGKRAAALQAAIAKNEGAAENPVENTLRWLNAQIKALVEKESADKARQERIRVLQTRIAAIGSELDRINAEIAQIEGPRRSA